MGMAVDVGDRLAGDGDRRCAVGFGEGLVDKTTTKIRVLKSPEVRSEVATSLFS